MVASVPRVLFTVLLLACLSGCYAMRPSTGGGQVSFTGQRSVDPADVALPEGYRIDLVATGLTFPTGVAFDEVGGIFVTESGYSYGEVWTTPRLLRIEPGKKNHAVVAAGGRNGPWNGVVYSRGNFYVAEGGELEGGRILRISTNGSVTELIKDLPSMGDHHTNGPAVGPDGKIYFGIGTFTNSGVVGEDNAKFGWLKRYPKSHDIPCEDVTLAGENYETGDALSPDSRERVSTGAFSPFGQRTEKGQVIRGQVPCSGSVLRINPDGGKPEVIAWGFRNPFGMAFSPDGQLFVSDNSYDERGSRPIFGPGDILWAVAPGKWHGWPDFHGKKPVNIEDRYKGQGKEIPRLVLAKAPSTPPEPVAVLGVHASADGFDFCRNPEFGHTGHIFIALFGDQAPETGKILSPVGFKVVRVDPKNGVVEDFAANKGGRNGPASWLKAGGLERPLAARFDPAGKALYVVDFGVMTMSEEGAAPVKETGVLWRITRSGSAAK